MNKPLFSSVVISILGVGFSSAQSIELMSEPDWNSTVYYEYDSGGRLCNAGITGADVSGWLGGEADGWYATLGREREPGDGEGEKPSLDVVLTDFSEGTLRCTTTDAGVCTGTVMTVDFSNYTSLTLGGSTQLWVQGSVPSVLSLWYESSSGGEAVLLFKDTITYQEVDTWFGFSYTIEGDQYRQMAANGTGTLYFIIGIEGSGGKGAMQSIRFKDLSLTGNIPEPATGGLACWVLSLSLRGEGGLVKKLYYI